MNKTTRPGLAGLDIRTPSSLKALAAVAGIALAGVAPAHAATLAGKGTFQTADDLTLIDDGGTIFEWLDLTVTTNDTPSNAVATLAGDGFTWATELQIIDLLDAFNTAYVSGGDDLNMAESDRQNFVDHFGATFQDDASLGYYDTGSGENSYLCVSVFTCSPDSFQNVNSPLSAPTISIGVFMVRPGDSAPIPLPATLPLLLAGIGGLALASRRKA